MSYIWLAVMIVALIFEAITVQMIALWFVVGAISGMISAYIGASIWVQIIVFLLTSSVSAVLFYKKLHNSIFKTYEKTNIDALIGKEAVAEEDISYLKPGRVKVNGMSWSAYIKKGDEEIKKNDTVRILSIDGVKLLCQKLDENAVTQQVLVNKQLDKKSIDEIVKENVEKAAKKRANKKEVEARQVAAMAQTKTKRIEDRNRTSNNSVESYKPNAKPGSLASKANMVSDFNKKNK